MNGISVTALLDDGGRNETVTEFAVFAHRFAVVADVKHIRRAVRLFLQIRQQVVNQEIFVQQRVVVGVDAGLCHVVPVCVENGVFLRIMLLIRCVRIAFLNHDECGLVKRKIVQSVGDADVLGVFFFGQFEHIGFVEKRQGFLCVHGFALQSDVSGFKAVFFGEFRQISVRFELFFVILRFALDVQEIRHGNQRINAAGQRFFKDDFAFRGAVFQFRRRFAGVSVQ